jgi:dehydratase
MDLNGIRSRKVAFLGGVAAFVVVLAACTTTAGPPAITTTTLPPVGVHTDFVWNCEALQLVQVAVPGGITVSAPATVNSGENFTIDYVIDAFPVPASSNGAAISSVGGWNYKFTMPTNATFVSASLSGGQGYSGTATVDENNGVIEFAITGSTPALGTADFPIITVTMNATGPGGATIVTSVAGTSYADPGFSFVSGTQIGPVNTLCFPYAPAPVFSSTQIVGGAPAPVMPQAGECWGTPEVSYLQGAVFAKSYDNGACTDPEIGGLLLLIYSSPTMAEAADWCDFIASNGAGTGTLFNVADEGIVRVSDGAEAVADAWLCSAPAAP